VCVHYLHLYQCPLYVVEFIRMMRFAAILAVLIIHGGRADDWRLNRCQRDFQVSNVKGFTADKILGRWYLKRETKGGPDCTSVYIGRNKAGELRYAEVSFQVGDEISLSNPATLKFDSRNDGSFIINMKYDSPTSLDGTMRVMGTDFDNYLVIYTCKNAAIFYWESFLVLSREWNDNPDLDLPIAQSLLLASNNQKSKITATRHMNCKDPIEDEMFFVQNEFKFVKVEQPKVSEEELKKQGGAKPPAPPRPSEPNPDGLFGDRGPFFDGVDDTLNEDANP